MKNRLVLLSCFLLFLPTLVSADMPPAESMDFNVTYMGASVQDNNLTAVILECWEMDSFNRRVGSFGRQTPHLNISEYDATRGCYWLSFGSRYGGMRSSCENSSCHFADYGYVYFRGEFKLVVSVPSLGKVFISNATHGVNYYHSSYNADLQPDGGIILKDTTPVLQSDAGVKFIADAEFFIQILVLTIVLELATAYIFLAKTAAKAKKKILWTVFFVNLVSLPVFWYSLWFNIPIRSYELLVIGEFFVAVFEALAIFLINKKDITLTSSFMLSLLMNAVSLFLGFALMILIGIIQLAVSRHSWPW